MLGHLQSSKRQLCLKKVVDITKRVSDMMKREGSSDGKINRQ